MTPSVATARARKFAGSVSLLAVPLALCNLWAHLADAGGDADRVLEPAQALALSPAAIELFHSSMLTDALGWRRLDRGPVALRTQFDGGMTR